MFGLIAYPGEINPYATGMESSHIVHSRDRESYGYNWPDFDSTLLLVEEHYVFHEMFRGYPWLIGLTYNENNFASRETAKRAVSRPIKIDEIPFYQREIENRYRKEMKKQNRTFTEFIQDQENIREILTNVKINATNNPRLMEIARNKIKELFGISEPICLVEEILTELFQSPDLEEDFRQYFQFRMIIRSFEACRNRNNGQGEHIEIYNDMINYINRYFGVLRKNILGYKKLNENEKRKIAYIINQIREILFRRKMISDDENRDLEILIKILIGELNDDNSKKKIEDLVNLILIFECLNIANVTILQKMISEALEEYIKINTELRK